MKITATTTATVGPDRTQRLYATTRRILAVLIDREMSVADAAKAVNISLPCAQAAIDWWHDNGLAYIAAWERRGHCATLTRIWGAGSLADAQKPDGTRKSPSQKSKEWRAKGGDAHRAKKVSRELAQHGQKIAAGMTLAGQLGANE